MKKSFTLVLSLLLLAFSVIAQEAEDSTYFHIGIGASLNSVWILNQNMYGLPEIDYEPTVGTGFMLAGGYNFTPKSGLQLELAYSRQGQDYEGDQSIDGTTYNASRDVNLKYFLVPVLYRYTDGKGKSKFNLMAGPQLGYLLSAKQSWTGEPPLPPYEIGGENVFKEDIKDRFNSLDIMMVADIGAQIPISEDWFITAGFRVTYGLMDINAEEWQIKNKSGEYNASKNFTAGITIGFNYKIDAKDDEVMEDDQ